MKATVVGVGGCIAKDFPSAKPHSTEKSALPEPSRSIRILFPKTEMGVFGKPNRRNLSCTRRRKPARIRRGLLIGLPPIAGAVTVGQRDAAMQRYHIEEAEDGWNVIDTWLGLIVQINKFPLRGLAREHAAKLAQMLNWLRRPANDA